MELPLQNRTVPPSEAVIERVANCEGVNPLELPPLYDATDPDALDALVDRTDQTGSSLNVEFTYYGYEITVTGEGVVHIEEDDTPYGRVCDNSL